MMKIAAFYFGLALMLLSVFIVNMPLAMFGGAVFLSAFLAAIEDAILSLKDKP